MNFVAMRHACTDVELRRLVSMRNQVLARFQCDSNVLGNAVDAMKHFLESMLDAAKASPRDAMVVLDPASLPKRELPPGRLVDLHNLYTARCSLNREACASLRTFYRALKVIRLMSLLHVSWSCVATPCCCTIAVVPYCDRGVLDCPSAHRTTGETLSNRKANTLPRKVKPPCVGEPNLVRLGFGVSQQRHIGSKSHHRTEPRHGMQSGRSASRFATGRNMRYVRRVSC
jgi:hypothetical protein